MTVTILVPAYNEENSIVATIQYLQKALPAAELVVIDDGSKDATETLARAQGVLVLRHSWNRGKAEALATGLASSTGEVVAMVDGDMGYCAGEIAVLVEAVLSGQCDMAIAVFASSKGGGIGLVRTLARWGIYLLSGVWLQAPLSGQRVAKRSLLEQCLPRRGGFGLETELTINAISKGYQVEEYATGFQHRGQGWSFPGFVHRGRQFFQVAAALGRGIRQWR